MEEHRPSFMGYNNNEMIITFEREFNGAKYNYLQGIEEGDFEEVD